MKIKEIRTRVIQWRGKTVPLPPHFCTNPMDLLVRTEGSMQTFTFLGWLLIGPDELPRRLGMAIGNEFSDHRFEKRNYLNLASPKIRTCALGPELVVDPEFESVPGKEQSSAQALRFGRKKFVQERQRCATAWKISSTITSSLKVTGVSRGYPRAFLRGGLPQLRRRHSPRRRRCYADAPSTQLALGRISPRFG